MAITYQYQALAEYPIDFEDSDYPSCIYDNSYPVFNLDPERKTLKENTGGSLSFINSNKKYVLYYIKFTEQFDRLRNYYAGIPFSEIKTKFSKSLSFILSLEPNTLSVELTYERSIFYTIKKGEYTLFFQHYLDNIDIDDDEVILSVFRGDRKEPSFAGAFEEAMLEISENILPDSTYELHSPKYELSC